MIYRNLTKNLLKWRLCCLVALFLGVLPAVSADVSVKSLGLYADGFSHQKVLAAYQQDILFREGRCNNVFFLSRMSVANNADLIKANQKACKNQHEANYSNETFLYRYLWSLLLPGEFELDLFKKVDLEIELNSFLDKTKTREMMAIVATYLKYRPLKGLEQSERPSHIVDRDIVSLLYTSIDYRFCRANSILSQMLTRGELSIDGYDSAVLGKMLMDLAYNCGNPEAAYFYGLEKIQTFGRDGTESVLDSAIMNLKFAANKGLYEAVNELVFIYGNKDGSRFNLEFAEQWYCRLPVSWRFSREMRAFHTGDDSFVMLDPFCE